MALQRRKTSKIKTYIKKLKEFDYFENRYEFSTQSTYLYNPYTGEICQADTDGFVNRLYSNWAPPEENEPSPLVEPVMLFPETYASRHWGRRRFEGFETKQEAATHLASVARGFLVRQRLRQYYKQRYIKTLDEETGYYYYTDLYDESEEPETFWYKPRLAFPNDINIHQEFKEDPEKFMGQRKYTYASFMQGPFLQRKLGTCGEVERADTVHFVYQNPKKLDCVRLNGDWDLDNVGLGEWIHMYDGMKAKDVYIDDYLVMANARTGGNVRYTYDLMLEYHDRPLIQSYGFHAISNMEHILDVSGGLGHYDRKVFEYCFEFIQNVDKTRTNTERIFALRCMYSYLFLPAGRAEFFDASADNAKEGEDFFEGAKGRIIMKRIKQFCRSVENCPVDTREFRVKEGRKHKIVKFSTPTVQGVEIALYSLRCIACLACKQDQREPIGEICIRSTIFAMELFLDEPDVLCTAMQCIYNFVYRCEVGQILVNSFNIEVGLQKIEAAFPGDKDVFRQVTRVRLCLKGDGWRGNVENMMDYDENGRAITGVNKKKNASVQSADGTSTVSMPPPNPDELNLPPVEMSVSVVEVPPTGGGEGQLNDVSILSVGGAEDQRRHK
mmetsp:Transcript_15203/g.28639  ORF Transcript_15203/g.28639 Transcript_15203/m.28639 type:complete len:612 (-) Transcript_15203:191-2026(-)